MFKIFNSPKATTRGQNGFTLLELLLVVGVGSLLLIGGIATYRLVSEGNRANDTSKMVLTMKQELQTLFQGGSSYPSGSLEPALTASGAWPGPPGGAGVSPFNTAVTATGAGATFDIAIADLPRGACVKVVRSIYGTGNEIAIGSTPVTAANAGTLAVSTCNAATNDITWTFL